MLVNLEASALPKKDLAEHHCPHYSDLWLSKRVSLEGLASCMLRCDRFSTALRIFKAVIHACNRRFRYQDKEEQKNQGSFAQYRDLERAPMKLEVLSVHMRVRVCIYIIYIYIYIYISLSLSLSLRAYTWMGDVSCLLSGALYPSLTRPYYFAWQLQVM